MNKYVYVVLIGPYYDLGIDSIYSSEKRAQQRVDEINSTRYGRSADPQWIQWEINKTLKELEWEVNKQPKWYGNKIEEVTKIDITFSDCDCMYRGNCYIDGKMVGNYSTDDSIELEKLFHNYILTGTKCQ